ncbi:hypothetical protein ScPMuIL_001629, partial [Solemya velum]
RSMSEGGTPANHQLSTQPEGSCRFYLERKRRYCRFRPGSGQAYCAEHASISGVDLGRIRIPCPLNPKHTCYEDKLQSHLKKCQDRKSELPVYHSTGINAGDSDGEEVPEPKCTIPRVTCEEVEEVIEKVTKLYDEHIQSLVSEVLLHPCMEDELNQFSNGFHATRHRKQQASIIAHLDKRSLLDDNTCYLELGAGKGQLSHWIHEAVKHYTSINFVLVDRGHVRYKHEGPHQWDPAGSRFDRLRIDIEHLNLCAVPCIARAGRRVVGFGKHLCGAATDLALRCLTNTLPTKEKIYKQASQECNSHKKAKLEEPVTAGDNSVKIAGHCEGIAIALCCHHQCTWRAYTGKKFFKSSSLSARDFQLISSLSSWGTCTWKSAQYQARKTTKAAGVEKEACEDQCSVGREAKSKMLMDEHKPVMDQPGLLEDDGGHSVSHADVNTIQDNLLHVPVVNNRGKLELTEEEREAIGRKCKHLIDYGRVLFLRDHGYDADLKEFISQTLTPENVLLSASTKTDNRCSTVKS